MDKGSSMKQREVGWGLGVGKGGGLGLEGQNGGRQAQGFVGSPQMGPDGGGSMGRWNTQWEVVVWPERLTLHFCSTEVCYHRNLIPLASDWFRKGHVTRF